MIIRKNSMNVFSLKMPFQESSETDPNCVCKEVGTLTESTVVSAECDKLQNFKDKLFVSEAQQLTCFQRFVLLTRMSVLWRLKNPTGQQRCTVALTALEKCKLPWCAVF